MKLKLSLSAITSVVAWLSCAAPQETVGKLDYSSKLSYSSKLRNYPINYQLSNHESKKLSSPECLASKYLLDRADREVLAACTSTTADAAECGDAARLFAITKRVYELDCY